MEERDRDKRRVGRTDFSEHFKKVKCAVVDADVEPSSAKGPEQHRAV